MTHSTALATCYTRRRFIEETYVKQIMQMRFTLQ